MTPTATGYAPINGINMYYEVYGEGDMPMVLVHGGGSTIQTTFGAMLPLLPGRLIAVELQAHGRTSDRDTPESFVQDADDVAALLQQLGIKKADIFGFSNGGSTALQIAIRHPEMVNKVIAASAATKRSGLVQGLFEGLQHATLNDMPAALQEAYLKVNPNKAGLQNMFEKDKARMLSFTDWDDDLLRNIHCPVLVIASDKDVITVAHTTEIAALIPGAQLIILPGMHGAFIGEASNDANEELPSITAQLIASFLGRK